ncbi:unnamed protein product, partial [marine sediment metagenome]
SEFGRFSLQANQVAPLNVYVPMQWLQEKLDRIAQANQTGEVKWSQKGMGTGSLMLADGKLIILSERGKLVTAPASSEGFKELSSAQILTGKC